MRAVRDLDLAEDAVQDAYADALAQWGRTLPSNPAAWLTTTARRRAIDRLRRGATLCAKLPLLWVEDGNGDPAAPDLDRIEDEDDPVVLDEQLRLIFLCAHPALAPEARVALTLRLVCGLETPDIAAAFLVKEATMAARLPRAKRKIVLSRIPCRVPEAGELPSRVSDVLDTVPVLLATGHAAPSGDQVERREGWMPGYASSRRSSSCCPSRPSRAGCWRRRCCSAPGWRPAWTQRAAPSRWPSKTAVPGTVL